MAGKRTKGTSEVPARGEGAKASRRFLDGMAQELQFVAAELKSFSALERELEQLANDLAVTPSARLSRRQVGKLARGEDIPLRCDQLQLLDEFLRKRGSSMASVFGTPYVVTALAEKGRVTFVMGSRPDRNAQRIDLSRWDIRAMREVLNAVHLSGRQTYVSFEDVIFRPGSEKEFVGRKVPSNEAWYHSLTEGTSSIVCIGSPKACHASEIMLARMFGVEPYQSWPEKHRPCPFFFVWPENDERACHIQSAFARTATELKKDHHHHHRFRPNWIEQLGQPASEQAEGQATSVAFWFEGQPMARFIERKRVADRPQQERRWTTFGIIAAQRRPGNHLWVCMAGLTGPASLAAAQLLPVLTADLSPIRPDGLSRTAWAVVEVEVVDSSGKTYRIDERRIVAKRLLGDMRYYNSPTGGIGSERSSVE